MAACLTDVNAACAPSRNDAPSHHPPFTYAQGSRMAQETASPYDDNLRVAAWLRQAAELLQAQGANAFRVGAYRRAADSVERHPRSVGEIFRDEGRVGLDALPGVGASIAGAIAEMLSTGRWAQLERLKGEVDPARLFRTLPGVGPALATRIHEALGVETLEGLEAACYDGRLDGVPGVGTRRAHAIRAALGELLQRPRRARSDATSAEPPVAMLLDVDREYRAKAAAGQLPTIAPRRFNPAGTAWLPILHTRRGDWHFTALYSNTARAHDLDRTQDWVVLYFYSSDDPERQRTVVTEQRGPRAGRRVVRGREEEGQASLPRAVPA